MRTFPRSRTPFRALFLGSLACAGLALAQNTTSNPTRTLMVLVDWWANRQMDTVLNLKVFPPVDQIKMVDGKSPTNLIPTSALTKVRPSYWYSWPNFSPSNIVDGRVRIGTQYLRGWYQLDSNYQVSRDTTLALPDTQTSFTYTLPPDLKPVVVALGSTLPKTVQLPSGAVYRGPKLYTAAANALTEDLNLRSSPSASGMEKTGPIDNCIDTLVSDTIWIRFGDQNNPPGGTPMVSRMTCYDHNPFFPNRASISVISPWSGAKAWAIVNGIPQRLRVGPSTLPGSMAGALWTPPGDTSILSVKFVFQRANGETKTVDSAGSPFRINATTANILVPTMGTLAGSRARTPPPLVVFAWANPWRDRLAELHFGGDERIRGAWNPQGWYTASFPGRPTKAGLVSVDGDSSSTLVDVPPATTGKVDTIWLTPRPTSAFTIRLEGKAYDYRLGNPGIRPSSTFGPADPTAYFPFSQTTNSWLLQGLVERRLNPSGKPTWTGKSICGASFPDSVAACKNPANAVQKWFDSYSQEGKAMNAVFPYSLTLSEIVNGSHTYKDSLFFPLDSFRLLPGTQTPNPFFDTIPGRDSRPHNFGYCIELHGEAQITPGGQLSVEADDDTWIFIDSLLVVDLGGQHSKEMAKVQLDKVPFQLPLPPLVALDIFHCERHVDESGMFLSLNFPVYPVGSMKSPPRVVSRGDRVAPHQGLSLLARSHALSVTAPAGQAWTLELRGLDGRLHRTVSGIGSTLVPWTISGTTLARLRSGGKIVVKRFAPSR